MERELQLRAGAGRHPWNAPGLPTWPPALEERAALPVSVPGPRPGLAHPAPSQGLELPTFHEVLSANSSRILSTRQNKAGHGGLIGFEAAVCVRASEKKKSPFLVMLVEGGAGGGELLTAWFLRQRESY